MDETVLFLKILGCIFLFVWLMVGLTCGPITYFEGSAKSEWLKQSQNIDIPWYKAAFLDVKIQDVDATIKK